MNELEDMTSTQALSRLSTLPRMMAWSEARSAGSDNREKWACRRMFVLVSGLLKSGWGSLTGTRSYCEVRNQQPYLPLSR